MNPTTRNTYVPSEELISLAKRDGIAVDPRSLDPTQLFVPRGPRIEVDFGEPTAMLTRKVANPLPPPPPVERVLVKAQNVHDYFMAHHEEHGWMTLTPFSCVRPPFPAMVVTYDHLFTGTEGRPDTWRHVDVIVERVDRATLENLKVDRTTVTTDDESVAFEEGETEIMLRTILEEVNPHEILCLQLSIDGNVKPGHMFVMYDATGQVLAWRGVAHLFIRTPEERKRMAELGFPHDILEATHQRHTAITMATLQFMNCRNVEVVEHVPTRQQRREAERRGTRPPVTYKTLVIHPVDRRAKNFGGNPAIPRGDDRALHICRGHFKDYRQGAGLGRWHRHGVWWWSPQVRGTADAGRVVKDYEVKP